MTFSRYKTIVRLIQLSSRNAEYSHPILTRLYSSEVTFGSNAPNDPRLKPKKYFKDNEGVSERPNHTRRMKYKRNYKLIDDPKYSEIPEENDDTKREIKVAQTKYDQSASNDTISTTKSNVYPPNEKHTFNSELEFESDSTVLNEDAVRTRCHVDQDNLALTSEEQVKAISREKVIKTPEGPIKLNLSLDEFDVNDFMKEFNTAVPKPLDECNEDLSDYGPNFLPTFNFAAYSNQSKLIQEYVKLGVKLYKVETNHDHMRALLTIDLDKELPIYIQFLYDCGIPANSLGDVITACPMILQEDLDDMKTRIRYLRAHKFTRDSIARIVTKNPTWLTWATKHIDERLGHYQNEFKLSGSEVRFLATKQPKLITYNMKHIHENTFAVREEMGFKKDEMKVLLLSKPRLWMNCEYNKLVKS